MSCRWLNLVVLWTACLLASPGTRVVGQLLGVCGNAKTRKVGESVPFGLVPAYSLVVELYVFFSTSTIGNSISLLICRQDPSVATVAAFPQLECGIKRFLELV